jgi:hypothetical protein
MSPSTQFTNSAHTHTQTHTHPAPYHKAWRSSRSDCSCCIVEAWYRPISSWTMSCTRGAALDAGLLHASGGTSAGTSSGASEAAGAHTGPRERSAPRCAK